MNDETLEEIASDRNFAVRQRAGVERRYRIGQDDIEWARLPDVERRFGLRRSKTYELIASGAIRSSCIRRKGAMTGVRLIDVQSVRDFLARNVSLLG